MHNMDGSRSGGASSNVVGRICPPCLVEIELTDVVESGGGDAPPFRFRHHLKS